MAMVAQSGSGLRALLSHQGYWQWSIAAQMARLPALMTALAFVLAGRYATGGYAAGGLMVTAFTVAAVCWSPFAGRVLDRRGAANMTPWLLALSAMTLLALGGAIALRLPAPALIGLAALAGALPAGVGGAMRSLLSDAVPPQLLAQAIAIDATIIEIVVVIAPLIVMAVAIISPVAGVVAMAVAAGVAALLIRGLHHDAATNDRPVRPAGASGRASLWSNPRFVYWLLVSLAFGHALGTAETSALPIAERLGRGAGGAAALIAALAVTSALSGIAYATIANRLPARAIVQAAVLLGFLALGTLALGFASSWQAAILAMIGIGVSTAPLNTVRSQAAEHEVPATRRAEAFSILFAAQGIGFALGGLFLAALPLDATLLMGGASAVVALLLAPILFRQPSLPVDAS